MAMTPAGFAVDGDEDRGGAILAQPFGLAGKRGSVDLEFAEELRGAERDPLALDRAGDAFAGRRVEAADGHELDLRVRRRP